MLYIDRSENYLESIQELCPKLAITQEDINHFKLVLKDSPRARRRKKFLRHRIRSTLRRIIGLCSIDTFLLTIRLGEQPKPEVLSLFRVGINRQINKKQILCTWYSGLEVTNDFYHLHYAFFVANNDDIKTIEEIFKKQSAKRWKEAKLPKGVDIREFDSSENLLDYVSKCKWSPSNDGRPETRVTKRPQSWRKGYKEFFLDQIPY